MFKYLFKDYHNLITPFSLNHNQFLGKEYSDQSVDSYTFFFFWFIHVYIKCDSNF